MDSLKNTKIVLFFLALIVASKCNPVPLTCSPDQTLPPSALYPNKVAFAIKTFSLSPIDMGRSQSSTCSDATYTGIPSNATCPSGTAPGSTVVVNENGHCPWTYVECFDAERIPMAIQVAQCQCHGCLDPYTHLPNPNLQCRPVKRNLKVLKRTRCAGGMYKYEEENLSVPVACACMRQRVA